MKDHLKYERQGRFGWAIFLLGMFGFAFSSGIQAQSTPASPYQLRYQLTAEQALRWYEAAERDTLPQSALPLPLDTLWVDAPAPDHGPGHYLAVDGSWDELVYQLVTVSNLKLHSRLEGRKLWLTVTDAQASLRKDAEILLDGRRIAYDTEQGGYFVGRPPQRAALQVSIPGDTIHYVLSRYRPQPRYVAQQWQRFKRTRTAWVVLRPYYWLRRGWQKVRRPRRARYVRAPYRPVYGYAALSQPQYRVADTLRFSAYPVKRDGGDFHGGWELLIRGPKNTTLADTLLRPDASGRFQYQQLLADSLPPGNYYLSFTHGRRREEMQQVRFRLADYELTAEQFTLRPTQEHFLLHDTVQLRATAKDANGFPAFGSRVEVVVTTTRLDAWEAQQAPVPDTLLHWRKAITAGELTLAIPDSLLPSAKAQLLVRSYFRAARGDLVEKQATISIDKRRRWQLHQANRRLYWSAPIRDQQAVLHAYGPSGQRLATYAPLARVDSLRIPPEVFRYELIVGADTLGQVVQAPGVPSPLSPRWEGDSLLVRVDTSRTYPLTFTIRDRARTILLHDTIGSRVNYAVFVPGQEVHLEYYFFWRGTWQRGRFQDLLKPSHELRIHTNQPQEVWPGAEVPVRMRVTDQQDRPVKRVRVHLGGVNAQFRRSPNQVGPLIPSRRPRGKLRRWRIDLHSRSQRSQQALLTAEWIDALALDTVLYQQLRGGTDPLIGYTDSVHSDYGTYLAGRAQFAPYVFHQGKQQGVYLIYCNRRLVYYHGVKPVSTYAFAGEAGYNQITLRTRNAEWTIDSVYLRAGWKTELALHIDRAGADPQLRQRPMPDSLTLAERRLLSQHLLQLQTRYGQRHQLYDTLGRVFAWTARQHQHGQRLLLGPFAQRETLTYAQPGYFELRFPWQQDYRYELYPKRERLYHQPLFPEQGAVGKLPLILPKQTPGQGLRDWRQLPSTAPAQPPAYITWQHFPQTLRADGAKLALTLPAATNLLATVLVKDSLTACITPRTRYFKDLPAGALEVYCFVDSTKVAQTTVTLNPHTTHFIDLRAASWSTLPDSVAERLLHLRRPVQLENYAKLKLGDGTMLYGQVSEATTGEPVLFASVAIYRDGVLLTGTETDFDGNYRVENLAPGWYDVEVSYLGLETSRIHQVPIEAGRATQLTIQLDPSAAGALEEVMVVAYKIPLIEQDATTHSTVLTSAQVRALPTRQIRALAATTAGLEMSDGSSIRIRGSRTAATAYYVDGSGVEGRLLSEAELNRAQSAALWDDPAALRSQFRDLAYWHANLLTDRQGVVETILQFPDDVTTWNTYVLVAKGKAGGRFEMLVRAYRQLQAQLFVPRFLVEGDELEVVGQSANLGTDTLAIETRFWVGEEARAPLRVPALTDFVEQRTPVLVPPVRESDSLSLAYALRYQDYTDGERRVVPVRQRGTRQAAGQFWALTGRDTTFTFAPDPAAGPLHLRWHTSAWPLLLEDLERVIDYPYTCNEQQASRLRALLVLREQQGDAKRDSLQAPILAMLSALQRAQAPEGYWGWFQDNPANLPLSLYVLEALAEAQAAGFTSPAYERGLRYLTGNLERMDLRDRLAALHFLARIGQQYPYATALQTYDTLNLSFFDHLQKQRIRQLWNLPYALDTVYAFEQQSLQGASYFGPPSRALFRGLAATQLLAHTLLLNAGDSLAASRIRRYALLERGVNGWTNTVEAASWVKLLSPYVGGAAAGGTETLVSVNGQAALPGQDFAFGSGQPLSMRVVGGAPAYLTAYQWVHDSLAAAVATPELDMVSYWKQSKQETQQLRAGEPAALIVEAQVRKAMDYAVLEIPIPAGCGYLRELARQPGESERIYLRDKLVIFYEHLPAKPLRIAVDLEPRFTGRFSLNPAKLEDLYFPTFFTRAALRSVVIE